MARPITVTRKRRTREHVIAELGVHYVQGVILVAGHTSQVLGNDYGYDLFMSTFDEQGYAEPGGVFFQVKASESLHCSGRDYVYDVDIRDYNLWMWEDLPVIFVLFDAGLRQAFWLAVQQTFGGANVRRPMAGARHVRFRVPTRQVLDAGSVARIRQLKWTETALKIGQQP
jgi:hypothetical protein